MELGIDSFAAILPDPAGGPTLSGTVRVANLLEELEAADQAGLDIFGIGEHHRPEFLDSAPVVLLAAAAARTKTIRLASAVTVLSATDPVRLFQEFATLDLISGGRAELVVGRGSFGEAYPLFGLGFEDYDALFVEKLGLLMQLRDETHVTWSGQFRPALTGQGIYPRPHQAKLPVWVGVGGTPESFVRAGLLGMPLMIAIIGGSFSHFRPLVDLYRKAGAQAGHAPGALKVGVHAMGFVAESTERARDGFYPGWSHMMGEIGKERGWRPTSRAQFDAMTGPGGAFLVGSPDAVSAKLVQASETLGGLSRVTFQMSSASHDHVALKRSIGLLGTEVAPRVRQVLSSAA